MRHGKTLGQLATELNQSMQLGADLDLIASTASSTIWDDRWPWIPPSPNLPTQASCLVYVGQVLLEGTNLSEGRGTTTPFHLAGAPFIDSVRLARELEAIDLPGIRFLPFDFRPTFDKWCNQVCHGVFLAVTDPEAYRPYATACQLIRTIADLWPDEFQWLAPPYEYEKNLMPIDIISGSDQLRLSIQA
jgi:uncharacterized protein YbbC (DUF1343 family)